MTTPSDPCADRSKHLEFVQAVVARLSNSSFLVKGWAMTLTGIIAAVATQGAKPGSALIGPGVTVGFWLLDSSYLRQERQFRILYEQVASQPPGAIPPFTMDAARYGGSVRRREVALSTLMLMFYGIMIAIDVLIAVALD